MSKRSQKKRQTKRAEKARDARKWKNRSIFQKISPGAEVECWMTEADVENRIASVTAFRRVGDQTVSGHFLIDYDCLGLKDSFYRLGVSRDEVLDMLDAGRDEGVGVEPVAPEEARQVVAAAIRWTRDHHFRIPRDTERALKVLGDIGDIDQADVSDFGTEDGGLLYVGLQRDLETALQDTTLEAFMKRPDVECDFVFGPDDEEDFLDNEIENLTEAKDAEETMTQMQDAMRDGLASAIRKWCFATGQTPNPRIAEAVELLLGSIYNTQMPDPDSDLDNPENAAQANQGLMDLLALEPESSRHELVAALDQARAYMHQFKSPDEMIKEIMPEGWDKDLPDDEDDKP